MSSLSHDKCQFRQYGCKFAECRHPSPKCWYVREKGSTVRDRMKTTQYSCAITYACAVRAQHSDTTYLLYKHKPASCKKLKLLMSKSAFPQMVQALYGLGVDMTVDCGIQWVIITKPVPVRQQLMPLHKMLIIILLLISAVPRGSVDLLIIVISVWLLRDLQCMPLPGVV